MKTCRDCGDILNEFEDFSWWDDKNIGLCNECYIEAVDNYDPTKELFEPDYPSEEVEEDEIA